MTDVDASFIEKVFYIAKIERKSAAYLLSLGNFLDLSTLLILELECCPKVAGYIIAYRLLSVPEFYVHLS